MPRAIRPAAVLDAVVEPIRPACPELDGPRDQQVAAPEGRKGHRIGMPRGELSHSRLQLGARPDLAALLGRSRRELASAGPRRPVGVGRIVRQLSYGAGDACLALQGRPPECGGGPRIHRHVAALPAPAIGVVAKAVGVEAAQEDEAHRGGTVAVCGGERERLRQPHAGRRGVGQPGGQLADRVGIQAVGIEAHR